jgi:hypothetical protein
MTIEHSYEILARWEDGGQDDGSIKSTAVFAIKPPIIPGWPAAFKAAILGVDPDSVEIDFFASSEEMSVFSGNSWRTETSVNDRIDDVKLMAERIVRFANHPEEVIKMQHEQVFTQTPQ